MVCVYAVQIDAGVAAVAGDLGAVEDGLRVILPPVPCRPLLHLLPCPAAEAEELVPVVLHEEQDPGDGVFPLFRCVPQAGTADVDMEAAGAGLMAQIPHVQGAADDLPPGHLGPVVVHGHGVGDDLQAVFQGAVMLDIDALMVLVGGLAEPPGLAPRLPGLVDLQLHTQVPGAVPVEDGHGLVAVIVDAGAYLVVAGIAVGVLLVVPVHVQGLVGPQEGPAAVAVGIVALVAVLAEGVVLAALVLVCPDSPPAVLAEDGALRQAVRAQVLAVELGPFR